MSIPLGTIGVVNPTYDNYTIGSGTYDFEPEYEDFYIDFVGTFDNVTIDGTPYPAISTVYLQLIPMNTYQIVTTDTITITGMFSTTNDTSVCRATYTTTTANETVTFARIGKLDDPEAVGSLGPIFIQWEAWEPGDNHTGVCISGAASTATYSYLTPGKHDVSIAGYWIDLTAENNSTFTGIKQCGQLKIHDGTFQNSGLTLWTALDRPGFHYTVNNAFKNTVITDVCGINTWDVTPANTQIGLFQDCGSFNSLIKSWNMTNCQYVTDMFNGCTQYDQIMNPWNTAGFLDTQRMFKGCGAFNQPLNSWNVSAVTNMTEMFMDASTFNQPLNSWSTTQVTDMTGMFRGAAAFDQSLDAWNVAQVSDMTGMFRDAVSFDHSLDSWNMTGCLIVADMFNGCSSYNHSLNNWTTGSFTDTRRMFKGCGSFNQPLNSWDVGLVMNMTEMFRDASSFNQPLNLWSVGQVTDMTGMFRGAVNFNQTVDAWNIGAVQKFTNMFTDMNYNQPLETWGYALVGNCTDMSGIFKGNGSFNQDISSWNLVGVTTTTGMFQDASVFNYPLNGWYMNEVTYSSDMFNGARAFNQDISSWDTQRMLNMSRMFQHATTFNQPIGVWNTRSLIDADAMFNGALVFNQDIGGWDMSSVTNMGRMFQDAASFNQPIGAWNTRSLRNTTDSMFHGAISFNQDLSGWDVSGVTSMAHMFEGATAFNQPLYKWFVSGALDMTNMFSGATNFQGDTTGWNVKKVTNFGETMFEPSYTTTLPLFNWTVSGGVSDAALLSITSDNSASYRMFNTLDNSGYYHLAPINTFVTDWTLSVVNQVVMPLLFSGDISVAWGDNTATESFRTADVSHQYGDGDPYVVVVRGDISGWNADSGGIHEINPDERLREVLQCGNLRLAGQHGTGGDFVDCLDMRWTATDAPNLAGITSLNSLFLRCVSLTDSNFSAWDTSSVADFASVFQSCVSFNSDITNWTTSAGTSMSNMFYGATSFNRDLNDWSVGSVTNTSGMFKDAQVFNQDLYKWDMSSVQSVDTMFQGATNFNGDITGWDLHSCTAFGLMFDQTTYVADNAPIFNWKIASSMEDNALSGIGGDNSHGYFMVQDNPYDTSFLAFVPVSGFVTHWELSNNVVTIPVLHNCTVSIAWGDSTSIESIYNSTTINHTYTDSDTHTVVIRGDISGWNALTGGVAAVPPGPKLLNVAQCGTDLKFANQEGAFANCTHMTWTAEDFPNLAGITNLDSAFLNCTSLVNPYFASWGYTGGAKRRGIYVDGTEDISGVLSMNRTFEGCTSVTGLFSKDIFPFGNTWSISAITSMNSTFKNAISFSADELGWLVSNVVDMSSMFEGCESYNRSVTTWNTINVTSMNSMFKDSGYNQPLDWSTNAVKNMANMFQDNVVFNRDLYLWSTNLVTNMSNMFNGAAAFSGDITNWNVGSVGNFDSILDDTYITATNPIFNWNVSGGISDAALLHITGDHSGSYRMIEDDTNGIGFYRLVPANAFVSKWDASDGVVTLPIIANGVVVAGDISVAWGDRSPTQSYYGTYDVSHAYSILSDQAVTVRGALKGWNAHGDWLGAFEPDKIPYSRLKAIRQCGPNLTLANLSGAFQDSTHLVWTATDAPILSITTTLEDAFKNCFSLGTPNFNTWDTSNIVSTQNTFKNCGNFNGYLDSWDTRNSTTFESMFHGASTFNHDISSWNLSSCTNTDYMFADAASFNQDLYQWDMSNVTSIVNMFNGATDFRGDVTDWDLRKMVGYGAVFDASYFDAPIPLLNWTISAYATGSVIATITGYDGNYTVIPDPAGNHYSLSGDVTISLNNDQVGGNTGLARLVPSDSFITIWTPSAYKVTIPLLYNGDISIAWSDSAATHSFYTADVCYTYTDLSDHIVVIKGDISGWNANTGGVNGVRPTTHLTNVIQCGDNFRLANTAGAFKDCSLMTWSATDTPVLNAGLTTFEEIFMNCTTLTTINLSAWDVSSISNMKGAFNGCANFNIPISGWDVSNTTTMDSMFKYCISFDQPLIDWSVHNVTSMANMFNGCIRFNQPLADWSVNSVQDMGNMFESCTAFNQPINAWDVSSVTSMNSMFRRAGAFNRSLIDWSVHNVRDMSGMFFETQTFNQDLYKWNTSKVTSMARMFLGNTLFRGDLTGWDAGAVKHSLRGFLGLLDCTYIIDLHPIFNWSVSTTNTAQTIQDLAHEHYLYTMVADPNRLGYYRIIPSDCFLTMWQPPPITKIVTIPINYVSDVSIAWGDNTQTYGYTADIISHTYADTSFRIIAIRGDISGWNVSNAAIHPYNQLKNVIQCGSLKFANSMGAFADCSALEWSATDGPRMAGITTLERAFNNCISLTNPNFNAWDVSHVLNTESMFQGATNFDGCINNWNTVNLLDMCAMFHSTNFNGKIGRLNVQNVENMRSVFHSTPFNQDISTWNVSRVTTMESMFQDASLFNQDLYKWNTVSVESMANMFSGAVSFYGDTTGWDARSVTDFSNIFSNNYSSTLNPLFNWIVDADISDAAKGDITQDQSANYVMVVDQEDSSLYHLIPRSSFLSKWSITNRPCGCYEEGTFFSIALPINTNSDVSVDWGGHELPTKSYYNTISVSNAFITSTDKYVLVNGDLRGWNAKTSEYPAGSALKNVIYCGGITGTLQPDNSASAFADCTQMKWDATDTPNIQGVTTMEHWFQNCASMGSRGNLSWDISAITTLSGTFMGATTFDGSINNWDTSGVTTMSNTFNGAQMFTQDISSWDVSHVTTMEGMFDGAYLFNQPLNDWSIHNVTSLQNTFRNAYLFNRTLNDWSINNVQTLAGTFDGATAYNQSMNNWNTENVTSLNSTFKGTNLSDGDVSQWNVDNVTDMQSTFQDASVFNVDLSWNVSQVTTMAGMFSGAIAYRGVMDDWDTSVCRDFTNFNLPQQYFDHDRVNPPQFAYLRNGITTWNVSAATNPSHIIANDASNNYMHDISHGIITYNQQLLNGIDVGTSIEFTTYYPHARIPIRPLAPNYRITLLDSSLNSSSSQYAYDITDVNGIVLSSSDISINDSCFSVLGTDQSYNLQFRLLTKQTDPCAQLVIYQNTYNNDISIDSANYTYRASNSGAVDITYIYTITNTALDRNFYITVSATTTEDTSFYDFTVVHDSSLLGTYTDVADNNRVETSDLIPVTAGTYAIRIYAEHSGMRGTPFTLNLDGINPSVGIAGDMLSRFLRDSASKITIIVKRSTAYTY
jgi:surface protein